MICGRYFVMWKQQNKGKQHRNVYSESDLLPHRGLFEAPEQMVVLHLEDVLLAVVVHGHSRGPGGHLGLGGLLLGDEGRTGGGLGDLDAGQTGLLLGLALVGTLKKNN